MCRRRPIFTTSVGFIDFRAHGPRAFGPVKIAPRRGGDAAELTSKAVRLPYRLKPKQQPTLAAEDLAEAQARDWRCAGYYEEMQNDRDRKLDS